MFFKKLTWIRPNQFLHLWPMEPPSHLTQETFFVTLIYIAASLVVYNMPLSLSPKFILLSTVHVNSCINNCNHIGKLLNAFFVTFTTLVTMVFLSSFILHLIQWLFQMLIGVPIMMIKNLLVAIVCFLGSNLITWSAKKQSLACHLRQNIGASLLHQLNSLGFNLFFKNSGFLFDTDYYQKVLFCRPNYNGFKHL